MPQERALQYFLPRSDPWQRCVHQGEPGYPVRALGGERVSDHIADVVGDEVHPFNSERIENASDILALRLLVVSTGGTNGEPHAAQVGGDNRVVVGKLRRQGCPHVAGLAIAVQQDDRRSLAADPHIQGRAIRLNVLGPEPSGKRLHVTRGWHGNPFMRPGTGGHPGAASTDICHAVGLNARSSSEVQTPRTLSEPSGVPSVWRRSFRTARWSPAATASPASRSG